jgi:hypothetical protein
VGCSYLHNIDQVQINTDKFKICATPGSGNQSMAARVVYECSQQQFDQVVVVWSGINRLDFPIGKALHKVQPKDKSGLYDYGYFTEIGDMVWYHSGGWGLSGCSDPCPTFLQSFFKNQYLGSSDRYLSEMSLLSIIQTQSFLASRGIPYKMSFIYDVYADYAEARYFPGLGELDKTSPLNSNVDWKKFYIDTPMFEYAQDTKQMSKDQFHPTSNCMIEWFKTYMDIDLTA